MPGIYLHIPFCKSKCRYCDFFSRVTNNQQLIDDYVNALIKEIQLQKDFLETQKIDTVYFGGGTPSFLKISQLELIFSAIKDLFTLNKNSEITLEANPEHLTKKYLSDLKKYTIVNRLSVGIQSFNNESLKFLGRNHNANTAIEAIENAKTTGFENITGDLIFGLPNQTIEQWQMDLDNFFELQIPHLSAYCLTIEEGTVFGLWKKKKRISEIDDDVSLKMYESLINTAEKNAFLHYEISNFAKDGFIAKHNFSYWTGEKYLGIGASAHSFNGNERFWNVSNIKEYIDSINRGIVPAEKEILTKKDKFNELILTGLRTFLGVDLNRLKDEFGEFYEQVLSIISTNLEKGLFLQSNNVIVLSSKGKFLSDLIMAELMII